jgi:lantibiotic biosynthesis protein
MYQATGEPNLGRAAGLSGQTVEAERAVEPVHGGTWVQGNWDPAQRELWTWTGIELVEGAAGVALVLLAAATSVEPTWDRMFLVSAPRPDPATPGE